MLLNYNYELQIRCKFVYNRYEQTAQLLQFLGHLMSSYGTTGADRVILSNVQTDSNLLCELGHLGDGYSSEFDRCSNRV